MATDRQEDTSVDQSNVVACKKQLRDFQRSWHQEAKVLRQDHRDAVYRVNSIRDAIAELDRLHGVTSETIEEKMQEDEYHYAKDRKKLEREYQLALEWVWKLKRRLRELIRWEREELDYVHRLESRRARTNGTVSTNGRTPRPRSVKRTKTKEPKTTT